MPDTQNQLNPTHILVNEVINFNNQPVNQHIQMEKIETVSTKGADQMNFTQLEAYGFDPYFKIQWETQQNESKEQDLLPARIIADFGQKLKVITELGECYALRPRQDQKLEQAFAVGDWITIHTPNQQLETTIHSVLTRKSKFSRAAAGIEMKEQIVASNIDVVFLVQSLNHNFNLKRLERYLITAWESGAIPVVILTKKDLCADAESYIEKTRDFAPGVDVFAVSNVTGEGIDDIKSYFKPGKTVALLGSSGVGKSALTNSIMGEYVAKTSEIREKDSKGRHTTTHRELVLLENGGMIIDTPGMRTLCLWEAEEGMQHVYGDIESLVKQCRFKDCKHQNEPGCAVKQAIYRGSLTTERWESWQKLQKEIRMVDAKIRRKERIIEKQFIQQSSKNANKRENVNAKFRRGDDF